MAPDRGRNRAAELEQLFTNTPQDFDPEADDLADGYSDSAASSDDENTHNDAREHYADVGKSKLRQPKTAALGPQYRGSRIGREAMKDDGDEDDPFDKGFKDEDSEDDHEFRNDDIDTGSSEEEDDEDGDAGETSDTDLSDDDRARRDVKPRSAASSGDRYELLKSLAKDQKDVASRLAQSTKLDAEKGRAVKKQRTAFDSLLGTRIKLQKALIGANTIVGSPTVDLKTDQGDAVNAIERAETAAFNLWSSLNNLREEVIATRAGEKRKLHSFANTTPIDDLWSCMQEQDAASLPHRDATLQRWSVKARSATVQQQHALLNKTERQATIIDALQEHITNPTRLLKRAHTPRSCAPLQLARNITEDTKIYDDADFYGILLKELLEQKSEDFATAANIDLNFNLQREAKTKRNVDTKASKGRKLRYTVHEKLQNFMAPEDRRTWGERQSDELFGSLFGQRMGLGEEVVEGDGMEDVVNDGGGDDGLMLFRS